MIKKADISDARIAADLACLLWPSHTPEELTGELQALISRRDAAVFLFEADGKAVGFAQCALRRDYVEGTCTSPVGYLEGLFVSAEYRKRGFAGQLVSACEQWAKEQGCSEFASDCELSNSDSLAFHLRFGFREANRIICFTKAL